MQKCKCSPVPDYDAESAPRLSFPFPARKKQKKRSHGDRYNASITAQPTEKKKKKKNDHPPSPQKKKKRLQREQKKNKK